MFLSFKNLDNLDSEDDKKEQIVGLKEGITHYKRQLTTDQNQAMVEICHDILSDDVSIAIKALQELEDQMKHLPIKEQEKSAFLQMNHINRIIQLMNEFPNFCFPVLIRLRNSEISQYLIDLGFLEVANFFIQQPNPMYAEYAIQIIGNNSEKYPRFRNEAYNLGIFTNICNCQRKVEPDILAWAISCGLSCETTEDSPIESKLSSMLVKLCDRFYSQNLEVLHCTVETFSKLTDRGCSNFQSKLLKHNFIYHLSDILKSDEEEYQLYALNILSGCIKSDEYLYQIFDSNAIEFFDEIFTENINDDYFQYFLEFLINSLSQDSEYIERIIERYCNPNLTHIFIDHSCVLICKGCRAIQTMFYLASPKQLEQALNPEIVNGLIGVLFTRFPIDSNDISFFIFKTFYAIFMKLEEIQSELVMHVAEAVYETIESDDYNLLIEGCDNEKIVEEAINMKDHIQKLLHIEE